MTLRHGQRHVTLRATVEVAGVIPASRFTAIYRLGISIPGSKRFDAPFINARNGFPILPYDRDALFVQPEVNHREHNLRAAACCKPSAPGIAAGWLSIFS